MPIRRVLVRSFASLLFSLLAACGADTASSPVAEGTSGTPPVGTAPPGDREGDPPPAKAPAPAADEDDPRSIFGAFRERQIDLFSSDAIVGVAPVDRTHVWVAVQNRGSLSVRMWDGTAWGPRQTLAGVPSQRASGYGLRVVGKGEAWAYGPGILHHLENGRWVNLSSKLARDATWGADGILAIGGWGNQALLTAQTSAYRWSNGTLTRESDPPYADVVFGASPTDAWAFKEKPFGEGQPAIYRKRGGGKWTLLRFGDAGDLTYPEGAYGGAASLTPGNVWALGNDEVMRQKGEGFEKVARPSSDPADIFHVVWTSGPSNTWVLGSSAYHFDGKRWSKAESDLDGTYYGIGASSPDVVWAYGATRGTWSLHELVPE